MSAPVGEPIRLGWEASSVELLEAIQRVQLRAKSNVIDPAALVAVILVAIGRVADMADAVGLHIRQLHPSATFALPHPSGTVATVVSISEYGYSVFRGSAGGEGRRIGAVSLHLYAPGEAR